MRISWKKLTALVAGAALVALAGIALGNVPDDEYETTDKKNLLLTAFTDVDGSSTDADVHAQCVVQRLPGAIRSVGFILSYAPLAG